MILTLGCTPAVQLSMTFDAVTIDGVNRARETRRYASGKSINATRVLRTLNREVTALSFAGGGPGHLLRHDLIAMGAGHRLIRVAPPTRTCVTMIDRSTGTATELVEESKPVDELDYLKLVDAVRTYAARAKAVLLAGSLPPGAPAEFYAYCMAALPEGLHTVIDAKSLPLRNALSYRPTVVKPNRGELSETVGKPVTTDDELKTAIRELTALGPKWAVVTDGPRPAVVSDGSQFFRLVSPKVNVVSAIGSGDSFAAGLVAGLCDGRSVPEACKLAAACGSANAMTDTAGGLSFADVQDLERRVELVPF